MFSYYSFETLGAFTLMRPLFITILVAMIIIFFTVFIPNFRLMYNNIFPILLISIIGQLLSAQLFFYNGILVDELVLSGDSLSIFLFMLTVLFAFLNPCIYLWNKQT